MNIPYLLTCILVMALVTYLPRMLPLTIFRRRITNPFLRSFLSYVPYSVLAAMTFPEILYSTSHILSALAGLAAAVALAFFNRGLLVVALGASGAVFLTEQLLRLVG